MTIRQPFILRSKVAANPPWLFQCRPAALSLLNTLISAMNIDNRIVAVIGLLCLGATAMSDSISVTATPTVLVSTSIEPVAAGKFQPTWESLSQYQCPEWFRDAKFGIWAHWGPQCQPEAGDWYARKMYSEGSGQNRSHVARFGHPSEFGFKDVINQWKAEKWEPKRATANPAKNNDSHASSSLKV
jgi:hypothetical protein